MKKILLTGAFLLLVLVAGGYWAYSEWGETTVQGAIEKSGRRGSQVIGAIDNDQTAEIKVTDTERKYAKEAKMVGIRNDRIWFVFVNKSDGPTFEIDTLSGADKVLNSKSIDIRTSTTF